MRIPNKFNGYSADNRRLYNDPVSAALVANAMAAGAGTLGTAAAAAAPAIAAGTAAALPAAAAAVPLAATAVVPAAVSSAIPGIVSQAAPSLLGQTAMTAAPSAIPGLIGSSPAVFAGGNPLTTAMSTGASGFPLTPGGVPAAQPSFFDSFKGFAKENPMLTQMGFSTAKDVLTPDQINPAPIVPVQSRGKLAAYDPMSYMNPYLQTVVGGGQPISLI
jgi:hypothetical protein